MNSGTRQLGFLLPPIPNPRTKLRPWEVRDDVRSMQRVWWANYDCVRDRRGRPAGTPAEVIDACVRDGLKGLRPFGSYFNNPVKGEI